MQKHFVTFLSPGTFVHEKTKKEIDSWDVDEAQEMARTVNERYGATPFAFYFTKREREPDDFDSKEADRSARYYLGGEVRTVEDVRQKGDPDEETLLWNMETNGYDRVLTNTNSWKVTQPLDEDDIVLDWTPNDR